MKYSVSVIIPAYNASRYIKETVSCVLDQSHKDLELIIINDGSTDDTLEIVQEIAKSDARVKIIDKLNSGVCDTRNVGITKANGDFTIFLDADDVWDLSFLETCVSIFKSNQNIHALYAKGQLIDENSKKLDKYIEAKNINTASDVLKWEKGFVATPSCTILRTSLLKEVGLWDTNFSTAADQDFFIRIASIKSIIAIDKTLFYYRVHDNNMHQNISVMEKDHIGVFNKAKAAKLFQSNKLEKKYFANLYLILAGSWWKDGDNKTRGFYFILKALICYPPISFKLISKFY